MVKEVAKRVKRRISEQEYAAKMGLRGLTIQGAEIPNPVPVAPPVGYKRQPTMVEHIRSMVRSEQLRQAAMSQGMETFEESDDFDVPEDLHPASPHEIGDLEPVSVLRAREQAARDELEAAAAAPAPAEDGEIEPAAPKPPKAASKAPKRVVEAED